MQTRKLELARNLRRDATWAEKCLWKCLRNKKLSGLKFRRQQCFGPYVLDFYCAEKMLNIEIDGGQHDMPEYRLRDEERTGFLAENGVRTVRIWNSQVRENMEGVLEKIRMVVARLDPPSPGPEAGPTSPLKGEV